MNRGLFITIEGGDGSGKDTQIDLLVRHFERVGQPIVVTREPGGTAISEKIREIILDKDHKEMHARTEALLYAASRAQHVEEFIIPKVDDGNIVICSRFVDSSVVYQGVARDLGVDAVEDVNKFATLGYEPKLTIYLDIPAEVGLARKKDQQEMDRLEMAGLAFHERVRKGYHRLAELHAERFCIINADDSINAVHQGIVAAIEHAIPKGEIDMRGERWRCTNVFDSNKGKSGEIIDHSPMNDRDLGSGTPADHFVTIRYDDDCLGIYYYLEFIRSHKRYAEEANEENI